MVGLFTVYLCQTVVGPVAHCGRSYVRLVGSVPHCGRSYVRLW